MDDYGFNNQDIDKNTKAPVYYTESYQKPRKQKSSVFQLILVSVVSSILGGATVFAAFQFVAPALQPAVGTYFGKAAGQNAPESTVAGKDNGIYKKIEISGYQSAVTAVAEKVSPSIVGVRVTGRVQDFFFGEREGQGEGSGIIIRDNGYILTNNHVIEAAMADNRSNKMSPDAKIEVILPSQKDKPFTAKVVGRDAKSDLAVLKIEATGLPAAELGDSGTLKPGEMAVAIGNPGGTNFMSSVTSGVISGLNRIIQTEDGKELTLIQTDAAINPGNSGGALCNSEGQVIGVNTIKIAAQGFEGLGFAIPINHAKEIANSLIEFKYVKGRPFLGVTIDERFTEEVAKQYDIPMGLMVREVLLLSAADKAGIKEKDIITKFDGQPIKTFKELEDLKAKHKPGDTINVEVYRMDENGKGQTLTIKVTLGEDTNQN